MNSITYHFLISFFLLLFLSCQDNSKEEPEISALSTEQIATIDSICQAFLAKGNTVGFSVAIAHGGETVFSNGYGIINVETKQAATENTIYAIASISKFITAVTTLKMAEQGMLSLEDKVTGYFEAFPEQAHMDEITIEHLLRHQSGLVDHENWFDSIYILEKRVFTQEEFFEFLDQPLFFRPGSHYSYSNSGYAILSSILEKVTGQSFNDLIVAHIGKPMDMGSLGLWPLNWDRPEATMGYELTDDGVDTSFHMMTKGMKGDGGLSASVEDLLKLVKGITDESLISTASLKKMLSPTPIGDVSIDYGLGVKFGDFNGQMTWGHSGGYSGTGWAMLAHYPESGYTFAAGMNTSFSPEEAWNLRHQIMPVVLKVAIPKMEAAPIANIEKYVGKYVSMNRWNDGDHSVRIVSVEDGNLFWDNPKTETPGSQLYPIGADLFSWKPYPFDQFKFHKVDGKVIACSEYYDGFFASVRLKRQE